MADDLLQQAIALIPSGPWAVGVSGGADSVAMLSLLRDRADLQLTVVHLDHETRGQASAGDAAFVAELAEGWHLPAVVAKRSDVLPRLVNPPANPSALYRACRLALFRSVVAERKLGGVILAHHADDQAETIFYRLLRGSPPAGLAGMSSRTTIDGLCILRPMLAVRRETLRGVLAERWQAFREDESNTSDDYVRNRLRKILQRRADLVDSLLELARSCDSLREWTVENAPALESSFRIQQLCDVPSIVAREAAKRWLIARGAPSAELSIGVLDRLVTMCTDASTAAKSQFPGRITVRRRRGVVEAGQIDTIARHEP